VLIRKLFSSTYIGSSDFSYAAAPTYIIAHKNIFEGNEQDQTFDAPNDNVGYTVS
jgi:hypothetical protein